MTKNKKKIYLFAPIFILIFLLAATNTFWMVSALIVSLITLLFVFLISILTDKYFKTNFKWISLSIFGISLCGVILGFLTHPIQEKWNFNKAEKFITEIEKFNIENGRFPKSGIEINLPTSRNGFYKEEFRYYFPDITKEEYIIKYFDGFWDTKVYVSSENKWYTED